LHVPRADLIRAGSQSSLDKIRYNRAVFLKTPMYLGLGTRVDPYEIIVSIGGMGEVDRACHTRHAIAGGGDA
jgi:hypothetical protein